MTAPYVLPEVATTNEHLPRHGFDIEDRDAASLEETTAASVRIKAALLGYDREQHAASPRQRLRPTVRDLAPSSIGFRQHRWRASYSRDALQCRRAQGCENNRVVVEPGRAAWGAGEPRQHDSRTARDRDFLQRDGVVDEADPLAVR